LRLAAWQEFDLNARLWIIPANRMKMRRPHRIPLAPQAIAILEELQRLTGRGELLFPGVRPPSRPLSENTLNAALRRLGYAKDEMSSHGFRAAASSLLNECGKWIADAMEAQLAHVDSNAVRKAYARAEYWSERVEMMVYWAHRLDELRQGELSCRCEHDRRLAAIGITLNTNLPVRSGLRTAVPTNRTTAHLIARKKTMRPRADMRRI
jgi:hypothetical protein